MFTVGTGHDTVTGSVVGTFSLLGENVYPFDSEIHRDSERVPVLGSQFTVLGSRYESRTHGRREGSASLREHGPVPNQNHCQKSLVGNPAWETTLVGRSSRHRPHTTVGETIMGLFRTPECTGSEFLCCRFLGCIRPYHKFTSCCSLGVGRKLPPTSVVDDRDGPTGGLQLE